MTTPDRRQTPRARVHDLIYVDLGSDNGGIVLDVSQGGLAFHAVAPVQEARTLDFSLLVMGQGRFDVSGELVWTDVRRTTCGVKFTSLPAGSGDHFQNWTGYSQAPVVESGGEALPAPQRSQPTGPWARHSEPMAEPAAVFSAKTVGHAPDFKALARRGSPVLGRFVFGILFAALLVVVFEFGRRMGELQSSVTAPDNTHLLPQTRSPDPMPTPVPLAVSAAPGAAPAEISNTENIPGKTPASAGAAPPDAAVLKKPEVQRPDDGQSELSAAFAYLNDQGGRRDASSAARLLWAAVAKGNSTAEVILADLYLHGEGLGKNCEQGRVLLAAASAKGNTEASKRLEELKTNGCP